MSVCLYLSCALVNVPINRSRIAAGLGLLAVVLWLLEISGVVRLVLAREFVKEMSMDEIDKSIRYGCLPRAVLTALSGLAGMGECLWSGTCGVQDGLLLAGLLVSASLSLVIWRLYGKLLVNTYRNANGNPGSRI